MMFPYYSPLKACVLWSHPIHMLLMAWHVLNKHTSPSHCTLRNSAYGHQHLWIVQSAIHHESLLNWNQLNIMLHNIASNGIRMLFYCIDLCLFLITIWQSFFSFLLQQNPVSDSCQHTEFWKQDKQTLLCFQYTSGKENTLQNSIEFCHFAALVPIEYYSMHSSKVSLNIQRSDDFRYRLKTCMWQITCSTVIKVQNWRERELTFL